MESASTYCVVFSNAAMQTEEDCGQCLTSSTNNIATNMHFGSDFYSNGSQAIIKLVISMRTIMIMTPRAQGVSLSG